MKNKTGRSISAKLNLWYTVLMCVLSIGLILCIVTVARVQQNSEVQQNLVRSVERNIDEIEIENGLLDIESDFAYRSGEVYALVYNSKGEILGGEYPEGTDEEIPLEEERFDKFNGYYVYDTKVEFRKYDYKINGESGELISSEVEGTDFYVPFEGSLDFYGEDCDISCRQAFDIAMLKSGLEASSVEIINARCYEYNDDPIYEIEFYSSKKAYEDVWVRGISRADDIKGVWGVLVRLAAVLLPVFTLIAALVGRVITKRALEPVNLLSEAVEETHSGKDLTKRIEISDSDPAISALADNFNRMFSRLQLSFESERQFSGDVSHELRTPTAVILAECEYQLSRQELDAEDKEGFEGIRKQALGMKQLISQLLEINKMENALGQFETENEDFSLLVNAVADEAQSLNRKDITLERDIEQNIFMDMDVLLITRLVSNLLSNAFNYGREKGKVLVSLKRQGGKIILSVSDDGIGIAPEHQEKIWNRFYRVDKARCREEGCSGLGLPMVKQIAVLHGGEIFLQSEPGKGSTFTVEFDA